MWAAEGVPKLLFVVGQVGPLASDDEAVKQRLERLGYAVRAVDQALVTSEQAAGTAAVLISSTCNSQAVQSLFENVATPFVTWQGLILQAMHMASAEGVVAGHRKISIVNAYHPIASGLAGLTTIKTATASFNWGAPGSGGNVVAKLEDDPSKATLFTYEVGAEMVGRTAPSRRVLFPGVASDMTDVGWTLLQNSVKWATDADTDRDGLADVQELRLGSNPNDSDSNDDGLLDGAAFGAGKSLTHPDMDGDGVGNALEIAQGTDPFRADTDGDGVADGADAFPLDPTRWLAPVATPGDHTPPVITLIEPTNAVLLP
jgi:hypothetical protein